MLPKNLFLHLTRLLLGADIQLNEGPFLHIRESHMLRNVVTKDRKNLNNCLFSASSLKNKCDFSMNFAKFYSKLENFFSPKHKFYSKPRSLKKRTNKGGAVAI